MMAVNLTVFYQNLSKNDRETERKAEACVCGLLLLAADLGNVFPPNYFADNRLGDFMRHLLILLAFVSFVAAQKKGPEKESIVGFNSITTNDLRAHDTFLSSSELEGRETSYRGQKVAAQYIAAVFRKLGLKPGAENGSYMQHFTVVVTKPGKGSTISVKTDQGMNQYAFGKDFITISAQDATVTAEAVFVGFQDATLTPEQQGSLKDKILVFFAGRRDTSASGGRRGRRFFRSPESAGTVVITDEASSGSIEALTRMFGNMLEKGRMSLKDAAGDSRSSAPMVWVGSEIGASILSRFPGSLDDFRKRVADDPDFAPTSLKNITISINLQGDVEERTSENVVGVLEGSDPKLRNEYVLFTAHYDHLGVGSDGAVFHGADDDGSGTSTVLELAEAFSQNPVKPKRTFVFMTVAGEEKGLLGSSYYSEHPLFPLDRTIADINMDMVGRIDKKHMDAGDKHYTYVIGSDKISTELDSLVNAANTQTVELNLDYQYNDDNDPNQFYRRSDHYNFARKGVPIVFFFTGVHEDYHRPTDTVDKIVFDNMVNVARLAYETGWKVGNFKRMLINNGKPSAYSTN